MNKTKSNNFLLGFGLLVLSSAWADVPDFQPQGRIDQPPVQQFPAPIAPQVFQGGATYFPPVQNPGTFQALPQKVQENPAFQTLNTTNCIEGRYGNTVVTQQVMQDGIMKVPVHQGGRF